MPEETNTSMLVSIKEFSDFTGVKQSILRYYDEIGLFSPVKRGENNYRYYSLPQIQTIKLIDTLRSLNIPLKKIEKVMESRSPEAMVDVLIHYELDLNNELRLLQESFALIHSLRTLIQSDIPENVDEIGVKFWEERRIALGPVNDFRPGEAYHRVYSNYYRIARSLRVNLGYPIGGYFDTFEEFLKTPSQPKRYFSLDPHGLDIRPAGNYLIGYTQGDYGVFTDLPERLNNHIEEHGLKALGPVYQVYPLNEVTTKDPNEYLARVSVRLA